MRTTALLVLAVVVAVAMAACRQHEDPTGNMHAHGNMENGDMTDRVYKSEEEWREELTEDEFHVLREAGTEPAGTSDLLHNKQEGTYVCAGCGNELFASETKYRSGTGWPSFYAPVEDDAVSTRPDRGLLGTRTEVLCARCDGHLGHVFDDGPEPTGLRYCINGIAMDFEGEEEDGSE